jgi:hypothetical protein
LAPALAISRHISYGAPSYAARAAATSLYFHRQQIDEECEKGNIITMQRFREKLKDAKDWEIEVRGFVRARVCCTSVCVRARE